MCTPRAGSVHIVGAARKRYTRVDSEQNLILLGGRHVIDNGLAIEGQSSEDPSVSGTPCSSKYRLLVLLEGLD